MKKTLLVFTAAVFTAAQAPASISKGGLDVRMLVHGSAGTTLISDRGAFHQSGYWTRRERTVYHPDVWGSHPMYFMGQTLDVSLLLRSASNSPRISIQAFNYLLETTGELGREIAPMQEWSAAGLGPRQDLKHHFSVFVPPSREYRGRLGVTQIRVLDMGRVRDGRPQMVYEGFVVWYPTDTKTGEPEEDLDFASLVLPSMDALLP